MSAICDRCNEKSSQIVNIAKLPELAPVAHLGYRQVCTPCYDDLLAEASETKETDEDRRTERRISVSIKARVEGNTVNFQAFTDEMTIEEISGSGLRLRTVRELEPGTILKISVPAYDFEAPAIVEVVWRDGGERRVGLKVLEPGEAWNALLKDNGG
jgi:hypothetical protein